MAWWSLFRARRAPVAQVNLASAEFKANPFDYYARLRAEEPVARIMLPTHEPAWLVTRYDDVAMVLKDERFVKETARALTPEQVAQQPWYRKAFKSLKRNMLEADPPDHTRLRGLVAKAFTPRLIEQMRPRIQALTDELLNKVGTRGQMDLIDDYAQPVPTTIIAEMLGVPVADRHRFQRWSKAIVSAASSRWGLVKSVPSAWAFLRYIRALINDRRAHPREDLVTALARVEEVGDSSVNTNW